MAEFTFARGRKVAMPLMKWLIVSLKLCNRGP